jgi:hypothetical protein
MDLAFDDMMISFRQKQRMGPFRETVPLRICQIIGFAYHAGGGKGGRAAVWNPYRIANSRVLQAVFNVNKPESPNMAE